MPYSMIDIHSHIIPDIDDGAESLEDSLDILRKISECGVNNIILTPHYSKRRGYTPSREKILCSAENLSEECKKANINVNLYPGCEVEYSMDIPELLKNGNLVTLAGTNYILTEFPPYAEFEEIIHAVRNIIQLGYIPLLAHIERYPSVRSNADSILYLKNLGAMIQVNLDSIISLNFIMGREIKMILKNRLADYVAGDVHTIPYSSEQIERCGEIIKKYASYEYAENIMYLNAEKIINKSKENI